MTVREPVARLQSGFRWAVLNGHTRFGEGAAHAAAREAWAAGRGWMAAARARVAASFWTPQLDYLQNIDCTKQRLFFVCTEKYAEGLAAAARALGGDEASSPRPPPRKNARAEEYEETDDPDLDPSSWRLSAQTKAAVRSQLFADDAQLWALVCNDGKPP